MTAYDSEIDLNFRPKGCFRPKGYFWPLDLRH